jgi:hypothetical protein
MTENTDDWTPAFPGQRPPFRPGHAVRKTHGARHPATIDPIAAEIVAEAVEAAPYLNEVGYRATLHAWAREEARCRLLSEYLDREGLHDQDGRLRPAEQAMHRAEVRASNLRKELGLTPLSRARLGRDITQAQVSITQALAARQAERERAQLRVDDEHDDERNGS